MSPACAPTTRWDICIDGPNHRRKEMILLKNPSQTYLKFSVEYRLAESEKR